MLFIVNFKIVFSFLIFAIHQSLHLYSYLFIIILVSTLVLFVDSLGVNEWQR